MSFRNRPQAHSPVGEVGQSQEPMVYGLLGPTYLIKALKTAEQKDKPTEDVKPNDADEDPSYDDCLFCHKPDERK